MMYFVLMISLKEYSGVPVPLPTLSYTAYIKMAIGKKTKTGIMKILKRVSVLKVAQSNNFLN